MDELEKALTEYCRSASSAPDPAKIASEDQFAKGIGGTKEDHVAEKIFSDLVRDRKPAQPDPTAECYQSTLFEQWLYGGSLVARKTSGGKRAPKPTEYSKGRWIRAMNGQGTCYLYIHTSTYQMQGTRPDDYVVQDDQVAVEDPYESFPSVHLDNLMSTIDTLWADGKAPLLLCDGDAGLADVRSRLVGWPGRPGFIFDVRPLVLGVVKTKVKFADQVEAGRVLAVRAMKAGGTLAVDLADVGTPDWRGKVCGVEDYKRSLPAWLFDPAAHREVDRHGQLFRKEDKADVDGADWDQALARSLPRFRLAYLTASGPGTYARDLDTALLPQGKWSAVRVRFGTASVDIRLAELVDAVQASLHRHALVPVVLDPSDAADTFLCMKRAQVADLERLTERRRVEGDDTVKEVLREKLVAALKHGCTLVLRLGDAKVDLDQWSWDEAFPVHSLFSYRLEADGEEEEGGAPGKTRGVSAVEALAARLFRAEDMEAGCCVVRPGFALVVTSRSNAAEARERLAGLPLHACKLVAVQP